MAEHDGSEWASPLGKWVRASSGLWHIMPAEARFFAPFRCLCGAQAWKHESQKCYDWRLKRCVNCVRVERKRSRG